MTRTFIVLASSVLLTGAAVAADRAENTDTRGEFVRAQMDEGLRGNALADAIQSEWATRKGGSRDDMSDERLAKLAAKATAKHSGKPEKSPRE